LSSIGCAVAIAAAAARAIDACSRRVPITAAAASGTTFDPLVALTVAVEAAFAEAFAYDATVLAAPAGYAPAGYAVGLGESPDAAVAVTVMAITATATGTAPDVRTRYVTRPSSGTVIRPTAGTITRPTIGTVIRPGTGTVTRPYAGTVTRP